MAKFFNPTEGNQTMNSVNLKRPVNNHTELNKTGSGIRIHKKRPMTTRKDGFNKSNKSIVSIGNQSGAFQFQKHTLQAQRDRSGGNSDEQTRDNVTSAVTGMYNANPESFNQTQQL